MAPAIQTIRPNPGPQTLFVRQRTDICIYGGSAGSGKTFGLLLKDLRHIDKRHYHAVTFRRTYPEIMNEGGLWSTSEEVYLPMGGSPSYGRLLWRWPSGASVRFVHMQYEGDKYAWQGSQIPSINWDELTHFSQSMFTYMFSRNRSPHGVKATIRATTNADADSWVADFLEWWIDQETGFPIPERAGQIRWMARDQGQFLWSSSPHDLPWPKVLIDGEMVPQPPKSVTFIPAKITDNEPLMTRDPGYMSWLLSLDPVEKARLLDGNWKIRPAAGLYFQKHWFHEVDAAPAQAERVRFWDLASTRERAGTDPDWTAGVLISRTYRGIWAIEDVVRLRGSPYDVERAIVETAQRDGRLIPIHIEQEGGGSGLIAVDHYVRLPELANFAVFGERPKGSKLDRARPLSAQAQAGNVQVVRGSWNKAWYDESESFDGQGKAHDDQIDGASGGYAKIAELVGDDAAAIGPEREGLWNAPSVEAGMIERDSYDPNRIK